MHTSDRHLFRPLNKAGDIEHDIRHLELRRASGCAQRSPTLPFYPYYNVESPRILGNNLKRALTPPSPIRWERVAGGRVRVLLSVVAA
ncbi:MAG TPA: hypothetical protein VFD66_11845 [Verrucomicrobiae bacterium]|nr:hypothetical protein [Verrucomicrobiae bacterium]